VLVVEVGVVGERLEVDAVEGGEFVGFGGGVIVAVVDFFDAVGAEHLHAAGAGFCGDGDEFGFAAAEEGAEVDLGMEHEFAAFVAVVPEFGWGVVFWGEAVIGGADDAVFPVEGDGADFAEGVFRAQGGDMGEGHGVAWDVESCHGSKVGWRGVLASG